MVSDIAMMLHRGTNVDDNFPRRFNHFLNDDLGVDIRLSLNKRGGSPVVDTHFKFAHQAGQLSKPLDVHFLRLYVNFG